MRIFYASGASPNSWFDSNLWRQNLYCSLVELGHDVIEFQYDLRETFQNLPTDDPQTEEFIKRNRPRVTEALLRQIRAAHSVEPVELFFSYFYDACVLPEAIDEIRAMGIKTVNWYCNGSYQLDLVSEISPHYDWCLVPEAFRIKDYVAMGARPIYSQEAANPKVYKPYDVPVEFDVTFVGQAYGERPAFIKYLRESGLDVRVWGYGWREFYLESSAPAPQAAQPEGPRIMYIARRLMTGAGWAAASRRLRSAVKTNRAAPTYPPYPDTLRFSPAIVGSALSDSEMIKMYSRSRINLGFSSCGDTHKTDKRIVQVRLRDFEVPMSGGFYMVEYMEELEEFYEIGKEIVCYRDAYDLRDKIKYYLRHPRKREEVRRAGYERCLRDHTWQKRFKDAFAKMGLA